MPHRRSAALFEEAQKHLVGGVNSPVRAFKSVGGAPLFIAKGEGACIYDVDGHGYIDYVGSYGPLILGHKPHAVQEALKKAIEKGTTFGASTEGEITLAQLIKEAFPHMDKVRFVNSGTEALMSAIRLARAYTGRTKIIKFAGCYHGHSDFLLAQAGSGVLTLSLPGSAGVPENMVRDTLIAGYNDIESVETLFEHNPGEIATIVVEPVPGNIGVVLPENDFLLKLREIAHKNKAVLIFDEVMSGFRQNYGGAQKFYGVAPDITCLGKIIGGGLPVGAYGARAEIMDMVAPLGPMYQAGTLSGNPLAMAAGIAMLESLRNGKAYVELNKTTDQLAEGIREMGKKHGIPVQVATFGSMITPFFTDKPVTDYTSAIQSDTKRFAFFFWNMIENGMFLPPSQFEAWFVSTQHGEKEIEATLAAVDKAFGAIE
jgi:glutamate-1-semialdehyde 2,1-aminomutase